METDAGKLHPRTLRYLSSTATGLPTTVCPSKKSFRVKRTIFWWSKVAFLVIKPRTGSNVVKSCIARKWLDCPRNAFRDLNNIFRSRVIIIVSLPQFHLEPARRFKTGTALFFNYSACLLQFKRESRMPPKYLVESLCRTFTTVVCQIPGKGLSVQSEEPECSFPDLLSCHFFRHQHSSSFRAQFRVSFKPSRFFLGALLKKTKTAGSPLHCAKV
ncbi:hypothetical protein CDAR_41611 [Caerostris darwini]|uniref:Uncharacterized protein n=1 Tax=Caerostris darwini TaxID=1538125 RepID=A0AAV4NFA8_9ARAC|nr:hypothetical protein CDAR_41611 [Caerostris darwini]